MKEVRKVELIKEEDGIDAEITIDSGKVMVDVKFDSIKNYPLYLSDKELRSIQNEIKILLSSIRKLKIKK